MKRKNSRNLFTRRDFIKISTTGTTGLVLLPSLLNLISCSKKEDLLFDLFKNPENNAFPFMRWWWNGNRVASQQIEKELILLKTIGIKGVEINPVGLLEIIKNPVGYELEWLSLEWIRMLKMAVTEAKKLDIRVNLAISAGWPMGGGFLEEDQTVKGFEVIFKNIEGPATYSDDFSEYLLNQEKKIFNIKLLQKEINKIDDIQDLTDKLDRSGSLKVEIPKGEHTILILILKNKFQKVQNPVKGSNGYGIDFLNKKVVSDYINNFSSILSTVFGNDLGSHFESVVCNSFDFENIYWTNDFSLEFKERRGYSVDKLLYLLFLEKNKQADEIQDYIGLIRNDYYKTLSELYVERFINTIQQWSRDKGLHCKIQSSGLPVSLSGTLHGFIKSDIPCGEQWLFKSSGENENNDDQIYSYLNKFASSAAHLKGSKIIDCQAMLNEEGIFEESLELIKQATDYNFITGINHLTFNALNSTFGEIPFPGWIYKGSFMGKDNPWWRYIHIFIKYTARLSSLFQQASPCAQIAILLPEAVSKIQLRDQTGKSQISIEMIQEIWKAFNHFGFYTDYLNSEILMASSINFGEIEYKNMKYKMLIVPGFESIDRKVITVLQKFAEKGGKIVFISNSSFKASSFLEKERGDETSKADFERLISGYGNNIIIKNLPDNYLNFDWTSEIITQTQVQPSVKISNPDSNLYFIHYQSYGKDIFFFINSSKGKTIDLNAEFSTSGSTPWIWNAESGERKIFPFKSSKNDLHIQLGPCESLLLVFDPDNPGSPGKIDYQDCSDSFEIKGRWILDFSHLNGKSFTKNSDELYNLTEDEELQSFAGAINYKIRFKPDKTNYTHLDLGTVFETAEVKLNGKNLGVKYWGNKIFDISKILESGLNSLEIKVTNLIYNQCISQKSNDLIMFWKEKSDKRKKAKREIPYPYPTGLIGPVKLY